ncbi:MAG: WD40 repeat domain-containing protein, partial [Verrucomicrobiales bacterium]|nr:WD40 repeat domain-containing protein [Verrucomicrobiales bacterium]
MYPRRLNVPRWLALLLGSILPLTWVVAEPEIRWLAGGHFLGVTSVDFLPDGQRLLSANSSTDVKLWDVPRRRLALSFSTGRFGDPGVTISPDGRFFLSAEGSSSTNVLVRLLSGEYPSLRVGSMLAPARVNAVSPSGRRVAASGTDFVGAGVRDLRVWSVFDGLEVAALPTNSLAGIDWMDRIEFASEDELILGSLQEILRWRVDGTVLWSRSPPFRGSMSFKAITPDRSRLLVVEDDRLKLLDSANGFVVWERPEGVTNSGSARFTADGSRFVLAFSAVQGSEGRLEIRAAADGTLLRTVPSPFQLPVLAFSPDGTLLACGHRQGIHLLRLEGDADWESLSESGGAARQTAVSQSGNFVATALQSTASGGSVELRRLDDGEVFRRVDAGSPVLDLVAAPDGQWLAYASNTTHLVRYRPATGIIDASLPTERPYDLAVSADGSRLAVTTLVGAGHMVDTATWTSTARITAGTAASTTAGRAAWSRDASRLAVQFGDDRIRIFAKDQEKPQFTRDWSSDLV